MIKIKFDRGTNRPSHKFHGRVRVLWGEQKPFQRKGFAIAFYRNEVGDNPNPKRFKIQFDWGSGAGYIGGLTAFVARNCKGKQTHADMYVNHPWQYGITKNANLVPHHY